MISERGEEWLPFLWLLDRPPAADVRSPGGMKTLVDLTGRRFGRWVVIERAPTRNRMTCWFCRCDCGTERSVHAANLIYGSSNSCGCYKRETITTHGGSRLAGGQAPVYVTWHNIKTRCHSPEYRDYPRFGGRGIHLWEPWHDFANFHRDLRPLHFRGAHLHRLDINGDYEPGNVVWLEAGEHHRLHAMIEKSRSRATGERRRDALLARPPDDGEYWDAVKIVAKRLHSDGCSGVPDFYLLQCFAHDIGYRLARDIYGIKRSRRLVDLQFRRNVQLASWFGRLSPMAWWRWVGLRLLGWKAWRDNRRKRLASAHARPAQSPREKRLEREEWRRDMEALILKRRSEAESSGTHGDNPPTEAP